MRDFSWFKNLLGLITNESILDNKTYLFKENDYAHITKCTKENKKTSKPD